MARAKIFMCLVSVLVSAGNAYAQSDLAAEITSVTGTVEICESGQAQYSAAEEGMELIAGDMLKTGQGASAELAFDENKDNVVRFDESTSATMLLEEDEKIALSQGRVFATIADLPQGASFEIKTPTAVAGVRGTDWVTSFEGEETSVEAVSGSPYVQGIDQGGKRMAEKTVIAAGAMSTVKKFARPAPPVAMPLARQEKWRAMRGEMKKRAQEAIVKRKEFEKIHPRQPRMKEGAGRNERPPDARRPEERAAPGSRDRGTNAADRNAQGAVNASGNKGGGMPGVSAKGVAKTAAANVNTSSPQSRTFNNNASSQSPGKNVSTALPRAASGASQNKAPQKKVPQRPPARGRRR